jgi:5'-nucleotidase
LVKYGLTKAQIFKIANSTNLVCRSGAVDFLKFCELNNIQVVIFSAAITGSESIRVFLDRYDVNYPDIKIITNELVFDDSGNVVGYKEPIIHSENKSEEVFAVEGVVQKKNTILAGDGQGDAKMVMDKAGSTVLRYAVLDNPTSEIHQKFLQSFDEVVSDFGVITDALDSMKRR